jgi:curved DNA-binding protein CbpA
MPNKYEKYYRILDLDVGASNEDVKKAFRELSHIWHPDNHMGKSSSVENRATEKFKELSNAYQVLKKYLSEEERRTEQGRRDREEEAQKRQEENERRKKEEESRRKAEQDRQDREEKERKYWEEQAKKKQEEEKSKQRKKEYVFAGCPKCKKYILVKDTTECLRKVCESCGQVYYYYFEDEKLIVFDDSNKNRRRKERANNLHKEAQKKTETIETADYTWGWGWAFIVIFVIPPLILVVILFALMLIF